MSGNDFREPARQPEELAVFFVERANDGDVEGLVALYEPEATLAFPPGTITVGHDRIRAVYTELLASRPTFTPGIQQPTLRNGDLAVTSTRLANGDVTAEVAHRQTDGTWRWIIDQPKIA
ncbi:YybH family protein [Nocardia sp. NPDC020380]|uniref:YybH family protein n=1 Tax=Nocardia sp. NPDC020380 TaxID=3364309 RepID=UPI0037AEF0C2